MKNIDWSLIKFKLREAALTLPHFFKNPVQGMRALPHWEWPETLILQALFAAACSVVGNILERDLIGIFTGLFIAPIASILMVTIGAGFFYYVFQFFFQREVPFRQVYQHVLFASIPTLIVGIVAFMLPPVLLVGAAATAMLLYVGFVSNFMLPPLKVRNLLAGIFAVYAVFWIVTLINSSHRHKSMRQKATPESLDILEKELNNE
jgi:hypothetical protein